MSWIRPATPGFLATLTATALLAAVSFGVPWIKSVYFLKATVTGFDGSLTIGTLGYCLDNAGVVNCSKASVGYEIDLNSLLGNETKFQIPTVVAKWITYCLVLHIVALILAAGSAIFGLLAHIREVSMTCCSTCISGFAAAVAMFAFIFDLALFFLAKARIKSAGGQATIGNAIWLTITAWILLFLSGLFFCCGRCCLGNRPSRKNRRSGTGDFEPGHNQYVDQVRMDAIKAEAERQAKQQKYGKEGGLPAFQEFQPLTRKESVDDSAYDEGNQIVKQPSQPQLNQPGFLDASSPRPQPPTGQTYAGGYMPGQPGGRAVDDYYNPTGPGYPPGPKRQGTTHSQTASNYSQSTYSSPPPSTPALPQQPNPQFLAIGGNQYGHQNHGSSYHSAVSHPRGASYDPYSTDPYASSNIPPMPTPSRSPPVQQLSPHPSVGSQYLVNPHDPFQGPGQGVQRAYTLGGSGYGDNVVPDRQGGSGRTPNPYDRYANQPPARVASPTQMYAGGHQPSSVQQGLQHPTGVGSYDDRPPTYDEHDPTPAGGWSSKA